ncbi:hypothetical protein Dda_4178 [Drechslerella dactyloides]|uniref:Uncharacterized protein n=1 Tax=Drechslerella dactyloides TaxID=74499 RepID=A0AAD6IZ98_DREDA|nr:hypothetical protein Dda_4178 [Drechslerella dactyloides]
MPVEHSRRDPPSPPRPPRPPPPTPEPQKRLIPTAALCTTTAAPAATIRPTSLSRQDPPSPPRAPPPSPTKHASANLHFHPPRTPTKKRQQLALDPPASPESFPRLLELTMALGHALEMPVPDAVMSSRSYYYCEDDLSVPGSPPPLSFSPMRREKGVLKRKMRRRGDSDVSCAGADEFTKRRRTIINLDDSLLFLPDGPQDDFGSFLESGDTAMLHERVHGIRGCAY